MKVLVQRPLAASEGQIGGPTNRNAFTNQVFDAELRPLEHGWYVLESLRALNEVPTADLPILHKGYFDSHLHATWLGLMELDVDLRGETRYEVLRDLILRRMSEPTAAGETGLLRAYGWDETTLGLSLEDLSARLAADLPETRPAILYRVCGHAAFTNAALRRLVQRPTDPFYVTDTGLAKISEHLPAPSAAENREAFLRAQRRLIEAGVSAIGDMSLDEGTFTMIRDLALEGQLKLDVQGVFDAGKTPSVESFGPQLIVNQSSVGPLDRPAQFGVRHWKAYLDGSLGARSAWLTRPYSDRGGFGEQLRETRSLIEQARGALEAGFHLSFHAIGDGALDQALALGRRLAPQMRQSMSSFRGPSTLHRLEHVQVAREDQLDELSGQGFWAVNAQPNHRESDRDFVRARLGDPRLYSEAYRAGAFLEKGVAFTLGSDTPVDRLNPRRVLECACTHENPRERLSWDQAVWSFTTGGRLNLGVEPGSLRKGATVFLTDPQ